MAPIVIEGDTLIERYRNLNKIVHETKQERVDDINYEDSDFENFFKIDVACKNRDVEFVLKVLQSEDMVYVSRALKRCAWLVTDEQHKHIINCKHLYNELYPKMMPRAFNKLLLLIRFNLKDESRAEEFFEHYKEIDFKVALKWLHLCSVKFTENIIEHHAQDIPDELMKRLCEKSITYLKIFCHMRSCHFLNPVLTSTSFLLKTNLDEYLSIVDATDRHLMPRFGRRTTKLLMRKYSEKVFNDLNYYRITLHPPTIAQLIKRKDMKDFIIKNNKPHLLQFWFTNKNRNWCFLKRIPEEDRFDFIKQMFIDERSDWGRDVLHPCSFTPSRIYLKRPKYSWYRFAPFDVAFESLKKVISAHSDPAERTPIFETIILSAGDDTKNLYTVLKHYRQNHIKEPVICKSQFVEYVLLHTKWHQFDQATWKCFDDIFSSLNCDKMAQPHIRATMLYNLVHGDPIPETIERKFTFDTFKSYKKKLAEEEKEKLFTYLYNFLTFKIDNHVINEEGDCNEMSKQLKNMLSLLCDWNKELGEFKTVLQKIKDIAHIKNTNKWDTDLSGLYKVKKMKNLQKLLLSHAFLLNPSQEACIDALKFRPELLTEYKNEVEAICLDENKRVDRFMEKLRLFWPLPLARCFEDLFMNNLHEKNKQNTATISLFTLLPISEVFNIAQRYAPTDSKIDRTKSDIEVNLCKNIAMNLRFARPLPPVETVLLYAKGDYLRYAISSLNTVLDNGCSSRVRKVLPQLLNSPLSLQKHGIRVAFAKLKADEMKELFTTTWRTTENNIIRAQIFTKIIDFLTISKDEMAVRQMWELLSVMIDNLTAKESKIIYNKMSHTKKIHTSIRAKLWMKSYKFLRSLPTEANCSELLKNLMENINDVMEFLDVDLAAEIFFVSYDERFSTSEYDQFEIKLIPAYLLSTKIEEVQMERYNKILVPIFEKSLAMWDKTHNGFHYVIRNFLNIFKWLDEDFSENVLDKNMIIPVSMFTDIFERVKASFDAEEYYVMITSRKLALHCVKIFDKLLKSNKDLVPEVWADDDSYEKLYVPTVEQLGELCVKYLKEDIETYSSSINVLFAEAYVWTVDRFFYSKYFSVKALNVFMKYKDFIQGLVFVTIAMPVYDYKDYEKLKLQIISELSNHPSKEVKMHCRRLQMRSNSVKLR